MWSENKTKENETKNPAQVEQVLSMIPGIEVP
jgi:hypothetical protein